MIETSPNNLRDKYACSQDLKIFRSANFSKSRQLKIFQPGVKFLAKSDFFFFFQLKNFQLNRLREIQESDFFFQGIQSQG